ncbi:MAG: Crp/Fnr family transcriptional regulator [Balneola sp.]
MSLQEIINVINKEYTPLSQECQQEFINNAKLLSVPRGEILVKEGQLSSKAYFIVRGCARAFYLKNGKDVSDWFAFQNDFISAIVSFFGDKPSPHYIEILEDSLLIEISKEDIEELATKYRDFESLIRIVVTKTMLGQQERIAAILFQTAEQKYDNLLKIYPDITQKIPLTHIASYLGITLETLSRIRNPKYKI